MSTLNVNNIAPESGTTITVGASGDTVNLGSGASTNGFLPSAISVSGTDFQFNSGYGSTATAYGCRAWVNFNGTGTVAIRDSGNVSSITDNGTGNYTVNFTTAMPDTNYAYVGSTRREAAGFGSLIFSLGGSTDPKTTSATRVRTGAGTTSIDTTEINIAFFR